MSPQELNVSAYALLLKIHVITGWNFPEKELAAILVDQFEKKMIESYGTVNSDEVEYALRNYGTTVKDWGKQMNLSLIDEVLQPYLEKRAQVSKVEEQKKLPEESKEEITYETWYAETVDQIRKGLKVDFAPAMLYDWLKKKGRIKLTKAEGEEYLLKATAYERGRLQERAQVDRDEHKKLLAMEAELMDGKTPEIILNCAKRMALYDAIVKQIKDESPDKV